MIIIENDSSKLAKQLFSLITEPGKYNYQDTHLEVTIHENGITVSTICINQYGSRWGNFNDTFVSLSDVPYFTAKKLGLI